MTRFIDKDGGVSFDEETVSRLTAMVEEIEREDLELVRISDLNREELRAYFRGEVTPEIQAKLRYVRYSELKGRNAR